MPRDPSRYNDSCMRCMGYTVKTLLQLRTLQSPARYNRQCEACTPRGRTLNERHELD
jgi:hypothetical protein